jgi:hypothetical protein
LRSHGGKAFGQPPDDHSQAHPDRDDRCSCAVAIAAAIISLLLVFLTFNRWFVMAVAINVAIIGIAL